MVLSPQSAARRFNFGHQCATDSVVSEMQGKTEDAYDYRKLAESTADELRSAGYNEYAEAIEAVAL